MSKIPEIGDFVHFEFQSTKIKAVIIQIQNNVLIIETKNGISSLTWNGNNWVLPDGTVVNSINLVKKETFPVCIKAQHIRPKYDSLKEWLADPQNVYVGRSGRIFVNKEYFAYPGSKWQNPFTVKKYGLEQCIELYKQHLKESKLIEQVGELKGKNLGCFCDQTEVCHAQILAKYADLN